MHKQNNLKKKKTGEDQEARGTEWRGPVSARVNSKEVAQPKRGPSGKMGSNDS